MASMYLKASLVNAQIHEEDLYSRGDEFWSTYEKKLKECNFDAAKHKQLKANLQETATRLLINACAKGTHCTWWRCDELWFAPGAIDLDNIVDEQTASFAVMHSKKEHCRIKVIIDLSNVGWPLVLRSTRNASFQNIIDGVRLWATLPHSIDQIYIIKSEAPRFETIFKFAISNMLSAKLQERIQIFEKKEDVLQMC